MQSSKPINVFCGYSVHRPLSCVNKKLELFLLRVHTLMNSYIYIVERGVNQKLYRFLYLFFYFFFLGSSLGMFWSLNGLVFIKVINQVLETRFSCGRHVEKYATSDMIRP